MSENQSIDIIRFSPTGAYIMTAPLRTKCEGTKGNYHVDTVHDWDNKGTEPTDYPKVCKTCGLKLINIADYLREAVRISQVAIPSAWTPVEEKPVVEKDNQFGSWRYILEEVMITALAVIVFAAVLGTVAYIFHSYLTF